MTEVPPRTNRSARRRFRSPFDRPENRQTQEPPSRSKMTPSSCLGGSSATLPEPMLQAIGSIPIRSFTADALGAAEITLGSLHGNVPKKELNLLQFAAGGAAEPSTTSTE